VIASQPAGIWPPLAERNVVAGNRRPKTIERVSSRRIPVLGYPWISALSESDPRYLDRARRSTQPTSARPLRTGYSPELS